MPLTTIKSSNIKDAEVKDVDISPTAAIASSKVSGLDTSQLETNAFNIGILGFKIAVNDGVTIFNLVDGIVDEFHDETGIDTAENSATTNYDSSGDFYQNLDSTPDVAMHLGVDAVTFENPLHAPLITFTSQEATFGAFGTQGSITFPSLTTSVEATMVGGGAGYSNPTYVPTPSLEYETAVGSKSLPSPNSVFDEAPYYTALPAPRQALFADGARGEGAASGTTNIGGDGGILLVFDAGAQATSMTLVSDTFTASTTPSTARIVVFAELPDGLSDFTVSATRDNTNYDTITLTDEGYSAGSSGIKIFSGSTPLTGAAGGQPQVQLRWKIVGTSLSNTNKIHGVALQWK